MAGFLREHGPPPVTLRAEESREQTEETNEAVGEPVEEEDEERKTRVAGEEDAIKERASLKQLMAIEELVQTERNFLKTLQLCTESIYSSLQNLQPPPPNLDCMFQHTEEVIDVSSRFLRLLDQAQIHSDPKYLETLCESFLSLSQDMEMVYKEYLANYNNTTALENIYKQKETLWAEIVKIIKSSAPDVKASTLSFFLVMPVQRIARYPLLLQTIQKHTDPRHPAYTLLQLTTHTAVQINGRINEYKRFREVADKYKKTESLTIKDKIVRLSGHSIAKKTSRFSQYMKHETGLVPKLRDEEFEALAGFFFVLEGCVSELHQNMAAYLQHLQKLLSCSPGEADLDVEGEKAALFSREMTVALTQWIYPACEERLNTLVLKPLSSLQELMAGPRNLIRKRQHKLLDYELIEEKINLSFEEQTIANTYKTINSLLLRELPEFNGKALQILGATLEAFICLQRDAAADVKQLASSFTHQLPHASVEAGEFWKWAETSVLEGWRRLESLCQSSQEKLSAPALQALSPAFNRRLRTLTLQHGSEKIYQLTAPAVGTRDLDLTVSRGELVAVLCETDTRGNHQRWLVDAGGPRGYVPSSKLTRYHHITVDPPSPHLNFTPSGPSGPGPRRHSYTSRAHPLAKTQTAPCFQVYAAYDFSARSAHELSLRAGEPVRVAEPHDKRGNKEWSLVEARGQKGYVPSNYLAVLPSLIASPTFPNR